MKNILFLFILLTATVNFTIAQTNETRNEKDLFVEAVNFLEVNPLAENSKEKRSWALKYSQGINFPTCEKILFLFFAPEVRGEVMAQFMMKLAAFEIEQSGKKFNIDDAQIAGLESALKVYEKIKAADSSAKFKKLDNLVELRKKNQLSNFVKNSNCK